jgi:hypothetical protein
MAGFTVTGLTTYIAENADDIYVAAITKAETLSYPGISIMAGVKNAQKIMLFANTAPFQVGGTCAFNASGSSVFTNRTLTVSPLKVNDTFCPEDLQIKFLSTKLIAGSNYDSMPFEKLITDAVVANVQIGMEQAIWKGDTASVGSNVLKQFDGWLKTIDAASPVYATATAALTTGNIIGVMDNIYSLIPAALLNNPAKPLVSFMGWDTFRLLITALKNANAFNFFPDSTWLTGEFTMPGLGLKVKAVHGLDNGQLGEAIAYRDRIVTTWAGNLFYGCDLTGEEETIKSWYSLDDQNIKYSIKWKSGVQIAYGSEIVTYKNI